MTTNNHTFNYRYEIGDNTCGVLASASTRVEAERLARSYQERHPSCKVVLFDRMAHRGMPDMWDAGGRFLYHRRA